MITNESQCKFKLRSSVVWWSCWGAIALMLALTAITLPQAAEKVPIHWGFDGTPDQNASSLIHTAVDSTDQHRRVTTRLAVATN